MWGVGCGVWGLGFGVWVSGQGDVVEGSLMRWTGDVLVWLLPLLVGEHNGDSAKAHSGLEVTSSELHNPKP